MNLFELYQNPEHHGQLEDLYNSASQNHPDGLPANFIEKDFWVTEILRLLYDESLLGDYEVAFKGGTALSKCWSAIYRFSEDIDLSVHWADLSGKSKEEELEAWNASTKSKSQNAKFRAKQEEKLECWSDDLLKRLNERLKQYGIDGLEAKKEPDSKGEKIDIHFPQTARGDTNYQLDHILLEFGGRNRGKPTKKIPIQTYLSTCSDVEDLPKANVKAFQQDFILWEKLTALHQFCTQTNEPNAKRLARHWYDVDCLLQSKFAEPIHTAEAMKAVIEMKKHRWPSKGVNYTAISQGELLIIPKKVRMHEIRKDHQQSVAARMFFKEPDAFEQIIARLQVTQDDFNKHILNPDILL